MAKVFIDFNLSAKKIAKFKVQALMKVFSRSYVLIFILILAFALRLYRIQYPILDWHSFRQVDTASVTREFMKSGISLLTPKYHDLGSIQSGLDNLEGYRMVEFPIINALTAIIAQVFSFVPFQIIFRLVSVIFSLGTLLFLYYFTQRYSGTKTALVAVFLFAVLPYAVYYSRAVLPEPALLFFAMASLFSFSEWLKSSKWQWYLAALVALSIAFLLKPFIVFYAPVFVALIFLHNRYKKLKDWFLYAVFGVAAIAPFMAWRSWIEQFPSGIPDNTWLFNAPLHGTPPRFRPYWFRVIFYERIMYIISGLSGTVFLLANLLKRTKKEYILYGSWWLGMIAYVTVIARGNVQHDYYQVMLIPIIMISLARGIIILDSFIAKKINSLVSMAIVGALIVSMIGISWYKVHGFFNVNNWEYARAGARVAELTPEDARVIAPAMGDTSFLFQTERSGWPIGFDIDDKIAMGATHYVSTSYDDEARELEKKYFILEKTPEYIILDLRKTTE